MLRGAASAPLLGQDLPIQEELATPHAPRLRRSRAPARQGSIGGQVAQMGLARTMSGIWSEKNSAVNSPVSSRQLASAHHRPARWLNQLLGQLDGEHLAVSFLRGPCSGVCRRKQIGRRGFPAASEPCFGTGTGVYPVDQS